MPHLIDLLRAAAENDRPLLDKLETEMMEKITGYWFSEKDELPNGDGRKVVIGETLSVEGKLELCSKGLHASLEPFDALAHASGSACLLYKVASFGDIIYDADKYCSRHRTAIAVINATELLHEFACNQALSVAHLWEMPEIVKQYLTTRCEDIRADAYYAAVGAATSAACTAAYAAAYAAADDAVYAARTAAYAAARAAADDAAYAAARAARAADDDVTRKSFNDLVEAAFDEDAVKERAQHVDYDGGRF